MSTHIELEKQTKRNIIRKIDDISDYLMKRFSVNGENLRMTYTNAENVAEGILSEIFGVNTASLHTPVDEEACQTADDILAQIREKRAKTVTWERTNEASPLPSAPEHEDMFKDIRKMSDAIMAGPTSQDKVDPFDAAMSIMEKK